MTSSFTQKNNLIQDCINGNRLKQKELYNLFAASMYSICLRYARNQMDAEDILQNGFIKLYNNLHKFRGEGPFEAWVRRIFVNSAIELLRERKNFFAINSLSESHLPVTRESPLHSLYEKDLIRTTHLLSDGYRTVFHLYAIEGLSHKEIAQHMGISESTSKSQYSRAKAILRKEVTSKSDKGRVGFAA